MKQNKNRGLYALAEQINAHLRTLPASRRPELPNRSRAQSVAYAARGYVEATDRDGQTFSLPLAAARKWLDL